jgi:glycopeptide antibiotics resistance protein
MPSTSVKRRGNKSGNKKTGTKKTGTKKTSTKKTGNSRSFSSYLIRGLWIIAGLVGVVAFAYVISRLTLRPEPGAGKYVHDNTHPGQTLRLYLDQPSVRTALLEIGGNLVLLMPLGVLLPVLSNRFRGPLRILLVVGLVSLCIETVQGTMLAGRAFDADDVILNTVGAVLAYLLVGRRVSRWAHRST